MSAAPAIARASASVGAALATELEALATTLRRSTVRIHGGAGRLDAMGAGVIWPSDGRPLVLTNAHVLSGRYGDAPRIESARGGGAASRVIARDDRIDLALLALGDVPDDFVLPATIGRARDLRVGELVVALGHPLGVGGALSVGIVHAVPNDGDRWVRADVRLAPGNSGGPLATLDGAVVGINSMIIGGLGIAISAHIAERFVRAALAECGV